MSRRTRIVATLGPATDGPGVLEKMLEAGVDVARINFSHGSADDHLGRVARRRRHTMLDGGTGTRSWCRKGGRRHDAAPTRPTVGRRVRAAVAAAAGASVEWVVRPIAREPPPAHKLPEPRSGHDTGSGRL